MGQELEELRRQVQSDPTNRDAALALIQARSRIDGPQVFLELLRDYVLWGRAPHSLREAALQVVGASLGEAYELLSFDEFSCGGQGHHIPIFRFRPLGLELNLIPGGRSLMGSSHWISERPQHEVVINRPFLMGRYPVTQREWDRNNLNNAVEIVNDARCFQGENLPIENVTIEAVRDWIARLGGGFRMPSESEWEFACRAGSETPYFWGQEMDPSYCWYDDNSEKRTHEVQAHSERSNAFGLVDMCGNVHEFCADVFETDYSTGPFDERPRCDGVSDRQVIRGGSWVSEDALLSCRSASRAPQRRRGSSAFLGFRLCLSFEIDGRD